MDVKSWLDAVAAGDRRMLARFLSAIENDAPGLADIDDRLWSQGAAVPRWGITGPPGAGKSTLVSELITGLRQQEKRVAVLAIDPSSPFSGGALLGDRIRMSKHAEDKDVYIRSLATRGGRGGLSAGTRRAAMACAVAGFDVVLIETAGVGQTELGILGLADTVAVVLVPEAGDIVQGMKAGIMEIADVFVVNKADRPGADAFAAALNEASEGYAPRGRQPRVLTCSALHQQGIDDVLAAMDEHRQWLAQHPERVGSGRRVLRSALGHALDMRVEAILDSETGCRIAAELERGQIGPLEAVRRAIVDDEVRRLLMGGGETDE